jgi:multidrug resistance efflux pump
MKVTLTILFLACCFTSAAKMVLATGTIESENTQHVLMPLVQSFNGKVNEMITESTAVKKGDFLAKIDGSAVDSKIESLKEQLESFNETAKKSEIDAQINLSNSQIAYEKALIKQKIARMNAELPLEFIGELKFKQNQLAYKNSQKSFQKAQNDLTEAKQKQQEKLHSNKLEYAQKQKKLTLQEEMLKNLTLYAEQEGYVVYSTHPWTGKKIQAGDQLQTGMELMTVSQNNKLKIVAWLNAIDIPNIKLEQEVSISFDAYLDKSYQGRISTISQGGEEKKSWGDGLYYRIEVELIEKPQLNLLIGMSALIETQEQPNE